MIPQHLFIASAQPYRTVPICRRLTPSVHVKFVNTTPKHPALCRELSGDGNIRRIHICKQKASLLNLPLCGGSLAGLNETGTQRLCSGP